MMIGPYLDKLRCFAWIEDKFENSCIVSMFLFFIRGGDRMYLLVTGKVQRKKKRRLIRYT